MTQQIKLMADYQCWPLWWEGGREAGDIDPNKLPLQPETIARLEKWVNTYDAQLNLKDPLSSDFFTEEELENFDKEGFDLWQILREELTPDYEVWFFSLQHKKLFKNPNELSQVQITKKG